MFTKWSQVEDWIRDNGLQHWLFTKNAPSERTDRENDKIVDSAWYTGGFDDKIAMTKKYLEQNGGRAYGMGFVSPKATVDGIVCEVRLEPEYNVAVGGVGVQPLSAQPQDVGAIEERIRKQIKAELAAEDLAKREKDIEAREKAFREMENGVWGLIVNKIGGALTAATQGRRLVAGIDTEEPVHAAPIVVEKENEPKKENPNMEQDKERADEREKEQELVDLANAFTDEEEEELYALLAEFKSVEPDYLPMLRKVVAMAKANDITYQTAKKFLI